MEHLQFSFFAKNDRNFYIADLVGPGEQSFIHTHVDYYEFLVVLDGSFLHDWNDTAMTFEKGTAQIIRPQDYHAFRADSTDHQSRLRNIAVRAEFFEDQLIAAGITDRENIKDLPPFQAFHMGHSARQDFREKTALLLGNESEEFKDYLFRNIMSNFLLLYKKEQRSGKMPQWLDDVCREMEKPENYQKGLSKMVELSGRSQEHLTRTMQEYYSCTPTELINQIRLQAAADMLVSTRMKIIDIVFECGYNNVPYFNRLFKEKFGTSPRTYRECSRKIF